MKKITFQNRESPTNETIINTNFQNYIQSLLFPVLIYISAFISCHSFDIEVNLK